MVTVTLSAATPLVTKAEAMEALLRVVVATVPAAVSETRAEHLDDDLVGLQRWGDGGGGLGDGGGNGGGGGGGGEGGDVGGGGDGGADGGGDGGGGGGDGGGADGGGGDGGGGGGGDGGGGDGGGGEEALVATAAATPPDRSLRRHEVARCVTARWAVGARSARGAADKVGRRRAAGSE